MARPVLIYDGDCGFCTRSALFVARNADVELVAFSDLSDDQRERLPAKWRGCAHLIIDGTVYSCGAAMERAYELTGRPLTGSLPYLRRIPGYETVREWVYGWIADHRPLVSKLTRRLF